MPIPASPSRPGAAATVLALFHQVHEQLRDELRGLDHRGLHWAPAPGANSIATIVTHLVGSEAETLRCVAGVASSRDREAEFAGEAVTMGAVAALLDAADDLLGELEPCIDPDRLDAAFPLPTLPADEARPGLSWLVGNYGHAREHVGHVQLTRQLYGRHGAGP